MTITTKQGQDDERAAFSAQFDSPEPDKPVQTEDEAFGIAPEDASADAPGGTGAQADGAAAEPAAEPPAADANADKERALKERESALAAREAELDQREAAMATSNVNDTQTSTATGSDGKDGDGNNGGAGNDDGADEDPEPALTEDFGPEFVSLMKRLIHKVCAEGVQNGIGGLSETVQRVIDDLNRNHMKAIKRAHDDFLDIVESPEFTSWKDGLPEAEKAGVQDVINAGSAEEIIDMLGKFKASKQPETPHSDLNDDEVDAAAGVRSGVLKLPPEQDADDDYAAAWNKA